eukprot:TRINITY_DN2682_c0_g1_i5.p1 TRINITY_DN2682_c0_g1~~TRINITY_DN2682_c0_g1_i5.p1  ORF type:complete len:206 (+),score=31.21 TRINITY_DN2682_c0_g1_i5:101-718(+)
MLRSLVGSEMCIRDRSYIIYVICLQTLGSVVLDSAGQISDYGTFSIAIYTIVVIVATLQLILFTRYFTVLNGVSIILLSLAIYYIFTWIYDALFTSNVSGGIIMLHQSIHFWASIALCAGLAIATDLTWIAVERELKPALVDFLRVLISRSLFLNEHSFEWLNEQRMREMKPITIKEIEVFPTSVNPSPNLQEQDETLRNRGTLV